MPQAIQVAHRFGSQILFGRKKQHVCQSLQHAPGDKIIFYIPVYGREGLSHITHEVVCKSVHTFRFLSPSVFVDEKVLMRPEVENFAREDGFIDFQEMRDFYYVKYENRGFKGFLLKW